MKSFIGAMILALTANFAAAQLGDPRPAPKPKPGPKVGVTQAIFDKIKAGMEENAAAILDGQVPNRDALVALQYVQYDKATWAMVKDYLDNSLPNLTTFKVKKGEKVETVKVELYHRLYIICKLAGPLLTSKPDVILEAMETVRAYETKYHSSYMPIPKCPTGILAACKIPAVLPKGPGATEVLATADRARQRKSAMEQPAICTNRAIGDLENIYCTMMAFAQQQKEDDNLVSWIVANEGKKNYVWKLGIDALNTEAASGEMSKERAQALFAKLCEAGKRKYGDKEVAWVPPFSTNKDKSIEWAFRWYCAYNLPSFNSDGITPDFALIWDFPGYSLLNSAKWMDMVIKGIKDPEDKNTMLVHDPHKCDSQGWKPEMRHWKDDRESWMMENMLLEKPPPGAKIPLN